MSVQLCSDGERRINDIHVWLCVLGSLDLAGDHATPFLESACAGFRTHAQSCHACSRWRDQLLCTLWQLERVLTEAA